MAKIKYKIVFRRTKLTEHAYGISCDVIVPGFSPSTTDHLVGLISLAIKDEVKRVHDFLFEDEKTFKEKMDVLKDDCNILAEKALEHKVKTDEIKRKLGLPIEEQKIVKRSKNPVTKKD